MPTFFFKLPSSSIWPQLFIFLSHAKYAHPQPRNPTCLTQEWCHAQSLRSNHLCQVQMRLPGYVSSGVAPVNMDTCTAKKQVFHPLHTQNTLIRQDNHSRYSHSRGKVGRYVVVTIPWQFWNTAGHMLPGPPKPELGKVSWSGSISAPWVSNYPIHFSGRLLAQPFSIRNGPFLQPNSFLSLPPTYREMGAQRLLIHFELSLFLLVSADNAFASNTLFKILWISYDSDTGLLNGAKVTFTISFETGLFLFWIISQATGEQCSFVYWESLVGTASNHSTILSVTL